MSKALARNGFNSGHERGQVVTDVALAHGASNVAAVAKVLEKAQVVCGPAASAATMWRAFDDLDVTALARLAAARAVQRRKVWAALAARPAGFPWLQVPGQVRDGWIVVDVDASPLRRNGGNSCTGVRSLKAQCSRFTNSPSVDLCRRGSVPTTATRWPASGRGVTRAPA